MTNQNNANGTRKPSTLNLERMTRTYFYPDLFVDDLTNTKIPTPSELAFLGANNVMDIQMDLRHEEKKFRRVQKEICAELNRMRSATPEKIRKECASPNGKAFSCNWRGMGYAEVPKELEKELMSNGDADTYYKVAEKRMRKTHTCRFGRYVAEWCNMTPRPCSSYQCFHVAMHNAPIVTGMVASKETDMSVSSHCEETILEPIPQCPHYAECYGVEPFKHEGCIFAEVDQRMLEDCKDYLRGEIDKIQEKLDYIEKYLHNITEASSRNNKQRYSRPHFSLRSFDHMRGLKSGDRIVEIDSDGNIQRGVFVCCTTDERDVRCFLLNMYDGRTLKIQFRLHSDTLYMSEAKYNYLRVNPDFRTVWWNMIHEAERFAVTPGVKRALTEK